MSIANCMQMKIILHASILDAGLRFNKIIWFVLCQSVVFLSGFFFFFFHFILPLMQFCNTSCTPKRIFWCL